MRRALYPGTFDPLTNGHLDLVKRALRLFDGVIVAVGTGRDKSPMFTVDERIGFVRDAVKDLDNVEVIAYRRAPRRRRQRDGHRAPSSVA